MQNNTDSGRQGVNVVIGYGKFGRRAVNVLQQSLGQGSSIVVIDKEPIKPIANIQGGVEVVCADAVEWLADSGNKITEACRIIPAVPIHFAAEWLKRVLTHQGWKVEPYALSDSVLAKMPHPFRLSRYTAVASHADFICPDNCSEPEEICTHTGLKRPEPLYQVLRDLSLGGLKPLILRSRQFAPGIGGYYPENLFALFDKTKELPDTPLLVGTACKCHGIVDGIIVRKGNGKQLV